MAKLLNEANCKKFNGQALAKNAMFYKDLLAFYDAYSALMEKDVNEIPNYCYWNGQYCLEGICLFIKDYAGALGFESLKLDLDYLKILYYTIASYSIGSVLAPRQVFEEEFDNYKKLSFSETKSAADKRLMLESELGRSNSNYRQKSQKNLKNKTLSTTFNVLAIFFLVLGVFCVIAPLTFYFLDTLELIVSLIISIACVIVGVILFIVFKRLSHKYDAKESGTAYELQRSKESKEESMRGLNESLSNYSKLLCEKYECQNNLSKLTFGNTQPTFDEVLAKACSYSVLSYNIKRDCILIFASQQKDVNEILAKLSKANRASDTTAEMSEIYRKIEEKDWLFYNNLVRFAFFNKYIEIAESTYTWELGSGANKFVPFGIDAKTIAREKVAFLKDSGSLFVSCTIDTLSKSNYLKKQDVLKIQKDLSAEEVRMLKVSYISKFYDYEKIKSYDNLFYDKRIGDGARIPDKILEDYSKIPLRFYIKLRLLETWSGLDNADNSVIKKIAQELFVEDKNLITNMVQQVQTIDLVEDSSAPKPVYECDEAIEIDNYKTKYISGGSSIIGYKIS